MALTYQNFLKYPIKINGIDSSYDSDIEDIEEFLIADLAYSGTASDLNDILPYFAFFLLCHDKNSTVDANVGESTQVKEFTETSATKQIQAWNIGVSKMWELFGINTNTLSYYQRSLMTIGEKIHALVEASGNTVNEKYLSKISLL